MIQLITPNPNIPCRPGWCLQYVRQAFGLPARYGTATEAWEKSTSQHRDRNFPAGVWLPVWYGLDNEPAGHVVLMAPDGSCYSTSDLGSTPHHHPDLADLERYYAYYGMTLTYRGWTEDVASYPVITGAGIAAMGTTTTVQEDDMASVPQEEWEWAKQVLTALSDNAATKKDLGELPGKVLTHPVPYKDPITGQDTGQSTSLATIAGYSDFQATQTRLNTNAKTVAANIPDGIAQQVVDLLVERLAK